MFLKLYHLAVQVTSVRNFYIYTRHANRAQFSCWGSPDHMSTHSTLILITDTFCGLFFKTHMATYTYTHSLFSSHREVRNYLFPFLSRAHTHKHTLENTYLPLSLRANTSKKPSPERMYCSLIAPNSSCPAVSRTNEQVNHTITQMNRGGCARWAHPHKQNLL